MQRSSLKQVFQTLQETSEPESQVFQALQKASEPDSRFNKVAGPQQIFKGDCFSNLLELSMVFGPVKKSSENVHISLKTKSKHQVTELLENSNDF